MYKLTTLEKVDGKLITTDYEFENKWDMQMFKKLCDDAHIIAIVRKTVKEFSRVG